MSPYLEALQQLPKNNCEYLYRSLPRKAEGEGTLYTLQGGSRQLSSSQSGPKSRVGNLLEKSASTIPRARVTH